jgi:serine/threonine-protein kinase
LAPGERFVEWLCRPAFPGKLVEPMSEPRTLGPYRLERLLGQGGMGAVWAARHVRTGRPYAVKVLLPEQGRDRTAIARFRREAEALAAVGHAHIVPIHDHDEGPNGEWFLAMDLLEGEDLAHRLARTGPMPWRSAIALLDPILGAIEAAHAVGLVHRDLKPSNVFLARQAGTAEEKPMLLDFGLARGEGQAEVARAKVTATGTVLGTPAYMSPEQARGAPIDGRSDLWALAVILFEMIAGRAPFEGPTLTAILLAVVTAPRPRLDHLGHPVPEALEIVLDRAMAKEPEARFADVRAFRAALAQITGATLPSAPMRMPTQPMSVRSDASLAPTFAAAPSAGHAPTTRVSVPRAGTGGAVIAIGALLTLLAAGGAGAVLLFGMHAPPPPAPISLRAPPTSTAAPPAEVTPPAPAPPEPPSVAPPIAPAPAPPPPSRAARPRGEHREPHEPEPAAPSVLAAPVPSEPPPASGPPPALVAATERMGEGDFDGCLRELEHAGTSAPILGARMNCALRTGRRRDLEGACELLHRHHPSHAYTSTCDSLLATLAP